MPFTIDFIMDDAETIQQSEREKKIMIFFLLKYEFTSHNTQRK